MGDEIGSDAPPTSRRTRVLAAWLVAAAVVVAGIVALRRGVDPVEGRPPASPPAAQMPSLPGQLSPSPTGPLPPVPALAVGTVCPARTDGRTRLDVSFTVVNTQNAPVTLVRAEPRFPLAGLRSISTQVRTGSCARPGPPVHTDTVAAAGTVLVVFLLGLPATCPAPLPVGATLYELRGTHSAIAAVPLFNDLGGIHFTTC
jgi:hypothetical protein